MAAVPERAPAAIGRLTGLAHALGSNIAARQPGPQEGARLRLVEKLQRQGR